MPGAVYLLSAATAFACAALLWRGWRRNGVRLLFWSALCFACLCLDNVLLYVDLILVPDVHFYNAPTVAGLVGIVLLLYGLIWDTN
jgi:hypothetical protein